MSNDNKKFAGLEALQTFLDNCKAMFASITHKHKLEDIEDYVVDTALSETSNNPVANKTINAKFDTISDEMEALESSISDKLDTSVASSTYETKTDAQTKLEQAKTYAETLASGKADTEHTHEITEITDLQETLEAKANATTVVYIDENDNETVIISDDITEIANLIGGDA